MADSSQKLDLYIALNISDKISLHRVLFMHISTKNVLTSSELS